MQVLCCVRDLARAGSHTDTPKALASCISPTTDILYLLVTDILYLLVTDILYLLVTNTNEKFHCVAATLPRPPDKLACHNG
jgi:hypothetical protein